MIRRSSIPVTVKCRLGADKMDSYEELTNFINVVGQSGVDHFIVHARKCILKGLTPHQNRTIPPLNYDWVYKLTEDFPEKKFTINGGIKTHEDIQLHLDAGVYGVMMGRNAYENPLFFRDVDSVYYSD
mmetsp:Transcript_1810/g.209  ORF Transcript_1810/g.209 Transcript_1810/m.209 type:complete len:128 (-) Transcript_1810:324-707(-)